MRELITTYFAVAVGASMVLASPRLLSAQVPERNSEPRLVPTREATAAVPAAQPPGQPTTAAPAEPAPVNAAPAPSGVTQLAPAAAPPATSSTSYAATAKDTRAYGGANFALTLDGINAGMLTSVNGGVAVGEVIVEKSGPEYAPKKHIGNVKYEPLSLEAGFESKQLMDWIGATWKGNYARKNGSVQVANLDYTVMSVREFSNALVVSTTIPTLDASAGKAAGSLTVTLASEYVRDKAGSGKLPTSAKGKRWMPSNFRLELGDLPVQRVSRIESFTVGAKVEENAAGELRDYEKQPARLVFPDLKITLSQADAGPWAQWHEDFVVKGNAGDAQEKNGAIVFLDPSLKEELGRINLFNCGIFRFGAEPRDAANRDRVARVTAELYCERMEFAMK